MTYVIGPQFPSKAIVASVQPNANFTESPNELHVFQIPDCKAAKNEKASNMYLQHFKAKYYRQKYVCNYMH